MDELNLQAERAAFEAWARDTGQGFENLKGAEPLTGGWTYFNYEANLSWKAWKAGRAAPVAQLDADLPPPKAPANEYFSDEPVYSKPEVEQIRAPYVERIRHLERELKEIKEQK